MANGTSDSVIWELLKDKQKKLSKAGLVANVENLGENIKKSFFDVKQGTKSDKALPSNQNKQEANKEEVFIEANLPPQKIDYFQDDDFDDEELRKLVENLP